MREKKQSDEYDQREISVDVSLNSEYFANQRKTPFLYFKKEADVLRQAVESEYTTLYRQIHKTAQKTAR